MGDQRRDRDRGERRRSRDRDPAREENLVPGHPWPTLLQPPLTAPAGPAERQEVGSGLKQRLVFVLMGGSNMSGKARLPPGDPSHDRLWCLSERGRWQRAREPIHPFSSGSGPGLWFGRRLLELLPESAGVFLVPCGWGGSRADDWATDTPLYAGAVARARRGAEACGGTLSGLLCHVGEEDALSETDARKLGSKLAQTFKELRGTLGVPDLLILMGMMGEHLKKKGEYKHCWLINDTIDAMASYGNANVNTWKRTQMDSVPRLRRVCAEKTAAGDDGVHYDLYTQQVLGTRYAQEWWAAEGHLFEIAQKQAAGGLQWGAAAPKPAPTGAAAGVSDPFPPPSATAPSPAAAAAAAGVSDPFAPASAAPPAADPFAPCATAAAAGAPAKDPFGCAGSGGGDPFATAAAKDPFGAGSSAKDPFGAAGGGGVSKDPFGAAGGGGGTKDPFGVGGGGGSKDPFGAAGGGGGSKDPFAALKKPAAGGPTKPWMTLHEHVLHVDFHWLLCNGPEHPALQSGGDAEEMRSIAARLCKQRGSRFAPPVGCSAFPPGWELRMYRRTELVDLVVLAGKYYMLAGSEKKTCDLEISHPSARHMHCVWYYHPDPGPGLTPGCYAMDLWTPHGTYINGAKLCARVPTPWPPGQRLRLGRCQDELVLVTPEASEAVTA